MRPAACIGSLGLKTEDDELSNDVSSSTQAVLVLSCTEALGAQNAGSDDILDACIYESFRLLGQMHLYCQGAGDAM